MSLSTKNFTSIYKLGLFEMLALSLYLPKQAGSVHVFRCCSVSKSKLSFCHHMSLSTPKQQIYIHKSWTLQKYHHRQNKVDGTDMDSQSEWAGAEAARI
jgi:hypothetical protein